MLTTVNDFGRQRNIELNLQHTLESKDLIAICSLAHMSDGAGQSADYFLEHISTLGFEQFFGFTCHLFITTDLPQARQQLAQYLPKFGSIAVLSLLKIIHHFPFQTDIHQLALQTLESMTLEPLSAGLADTIEEYVESDLMDEVVIPNLIKLIYHHEDALLSMLSQQLSAQHWTATETKLLQALSSTESTERPSANTHRIRIRVKSRPSQSSPVAAQALEVA